MIPACEAAESRSIREAVLAEIAKLRQDLAKGAEGRVENGNPRGGGGQKILLIVWWSCF